MKNARTQPRHPIQVVVHRTGLSQHVLRVWERRYAAFSPSRSSGNQRLYSDADLERIQLLRRAIAGGRSIGRLATLSNRELERLIDEDHAQAASSTPQVGPLTQSSTLPEEYLEDCLAALQEFDVLRFEQVLARASADLEPGVLCEGLFAPLLETVGRRWHEGRMRIAHEHLASSAIEGWLSFLRRRAPQPPIEPVLLVATPARQFHELGALLVATTAVEAGWRTIYLGANLPVEEIAMAAASIRPRALALSLVHPADDSRLSEDLVRLAELLGPSVPIWVGGSAAVAYQSTCQAIGAELIPTLARLRQRLESCQTAVSSGSGSAESLCDLSK